MRIRTYASFSTLIPRFPPIQIVGDLKASAGRQTRNAAKGVVYQPPVKKAKAPKGEGKKGKPAKAKAAEPVEEAAEEKVADAADAAADE